MKTNKQDVGSEFCLAVMYNKMYNMQYDNRPFLYVLIRNAECLCE